MRAVCSFLIIFSFMASVQAADPCSSQDLHSRITDVQELMQPQIFSHKDCKQFNQAWPTLVGLIRPEKKKFIDYGGFSTDNLLGSHYAVRISVTNQDGTKGYRILDPQFAEKPLSVSEYSQALTGAPCSENKDSFCRVEIRKPTAFPIHWLPAVMGGSETPVVDPCGWNELERSKKDIEGINRTLGENPVGLSDIPSEAQNLSEPEMLAFLQKKKLRGVVDLHKEQIERYQLLIKNLDKGQFAVGFSLVNLNDPGLSPEQKKIFEAQAQATRKETMGAIKKSQDQIKYLEEELRRREQL